MKVTAYNAWVVNSMIEKQNVKTAIASKNQDDDVRRI